MIQATPYRTTQLLAKGQERIPALPLAVKDAKATREILFDLRHFHLGDPSAKDRLEPAGADLLPALLDPFRDTSLLRYDYPLYLAPPDPERGDLGATELAYPLARWLQEGVKEFPAEAETPPILQEHWPWIDHQIRRVIQYPDGPLAMEPLLRAAGQALADHLQLAEPERRRLDQELAWLLQALPEGAQILGYGRYAALNLLIHAIRARVTARRTRFRAQVGTCIRGLKALLDLDWGKSVEAIEPRHARDSLGPQGSRFDAEALSAVMDHTQGTRPLSRERRRRIERALDTLTRWRADPVMVCFVHAGGLACGWLRQDPSTSDLTDPDPCARATQVFDQLAADLAQVFAAARIAQLEMERLYDPVLHDPWFANFNWEAFSHDELLLVPTVLAIESADRVAGPGLASFSRLLGSGRPVQILIRVQPSNNPGAAPEESPFRHYRTELGYLGISHRQAVVSQSSAARHKHLLTCFLSALDATRTSLHLINTGLRAGTRLVPLNAWLVAGSAIEGRAHPFFHINPEAGDFGAERMSFDGNPQPEQDWPLHPFQYRDDNGNLTGIQLAFTFADYALLQDRLLEHFRIIPPGCDSDALVPIQDYLAMAPDQAHQQVPFIWAVDQGGLLHRLVVSRELALACLDRLNYWHALQELAGVRNPYLELARTQARDQAEARMREERERLAASHAAELAWTRADAADRALRRLTEVLRGLDLDLGGPLPDAGPSPVPANGVEPTPAAAASQPAEEYREPWIDTPLCTSCADCKKVNPRLFILDPDKQMRLGDLGHGSYAQLVTAAELCPARCIHPGRPWNPDEADLEQLLRRAAPFNP